jgi:hypothetical protein
VRGSDLVALPLDSLGVQVKPWGEKAKLLLSVRNKREEQHACEGSESNAQTCRFTSESQIEVSHGVKL